MDDVVFNFKMYGYDDENFFVVIFVMQLIFSLNICSCVCIMDCYIVFEVYIFIFYKNIDIFLIKELLVNIE